MLCHLAESIPNRKVRYIEVTITQSNKASKALFSSETGYLDADFIFEEKLFLEEYFCGLDHEPELLFHIGSIN